MKLSAVKFRMTSITSTLVKTKIKAANVARTPCENRRKQLKHEYGTLTEYRRTKYNDRVGKYDHVLNTESREMHAYGDTKRLHSRLHTDRLEWPEKRPGMCGRP